MSDASATRCRGAAVMPGRSMLWHTCLTMHATPMRAHAQFKYVVDDVWMPAPFEPTVTNIEVSQPLIREPCSCRVLPLSAHGILAGTAMKAMATQMAHFRVPCVRLLPAEPPQQLPRGGPHHGVPDHSTRRIPGPGRG